jgi:Protein of unknown function (DUF2721)
MIFVPDSGQLAQVMSQATAPAFVLGAVAAFIAVLLSRMTVVLDRIRSLNEIADDDAVRAHLKSDIPRLRQRAKLLNSAVYLALQWNLHVVAPGRGICERLLQAAARIWSRVSFRSGDRAVGRVALQVCTGGENRAQRVRSLSVSCSA